MYSAVLMDESFTEMIRKVMNENPMIRETPKKVIFNPPATIVFWYDGTKTVVKVAKGEKYDPLTGYCVACCKHILKNNDYRNLFRALQADNKELALALALMRLMGMKDSPKAIKKVIFDRNPSYQKYLENEALKQKETKEKKTSKKSK